MPANTIDRRRYCCADCGAGFRPLDPVKALLMSAVKLALRFGDACPKHYLSLPPPLIDPSNRRQRVILRGFLSPKCFLRTRSFLAFRRRSARVLSL